VNARNSEVGERASAKPTIAVVDYGAGNLTSVLKGLAAAGADPHVAHDPGELASAAAIVVPGVVGFLILWRRGRVRPDRDAGERATAPWR